MRERERESEREREREREREIVDEQTYTQKVNKNMNAYVKLIQY